MKTDVKFIQWCLGLLLMSCLILACSKDGEQGPIGTQGPQGEQGLPGVDGQNGEDGTDGAQGEPGELGTANVIYSEWFPSEFPDDIALARDSFSVGAPELTDDNIENGLLLVFGRTFNVIDDTLIEQLPRTFFVRDQYYYHRYITNPATTNPQQFEIIVESIDGGFIGTPFFEEYRYFIIPGGIPTSGKSAVNYTKMTYEEISTHFNIPK